MTKPKLRLYVWRDFCPDHTSGIAFAIAKDETEARTLVREFHGREPYQWGDLSSYPVTRKIAFAITGGG